MLSKLYINKNKLLNPNATKVSLNCSLVTDFFLYRSAHLYNISGVISTSKYYYFSLYKILISLKQSFYHLMCLKMLLFSFIFDSLLIRLSLTLFLVFLCFGCILLLFLGLCLIICLIMRSLTFFKCFLLLCE